MEASPSVLDDDRRYQEAFSRNIGLLTEAEQAVLRRACVAIPGMGGVGGAHLLTLSRLGVGRFVIADGDVFELANVNRQAGATVQTLGRSKVEVMAEMARAINPALVLRSVAEDLHAGNVDAFLSGVDVVVDGIDFFRIDARRMLFRRARERGLPVITCAPLGFSVACLIFTPEGPSFDEFFALADGMDEVEQLARFAVGLAPAGLHVPYLDIRRVSLSAHRGPSSAIAVNLCAAVAATEVLNCLLKRRAVWAVPRYAQFDPYRLRYRRGVLYWGNRHPLQRLKLWYLRRHLARHVRSS